MDNRKNDFWEKKYYTYHVYGRIDKRLNQEITKIKIEEILSQLSNILIIFKNLIKGVNHEIFYKIIQCTITNILVKCINVMQQFN